MSNFRRYFSENNTVFITIVTYNRTPILIENIKLLKDSLKNIKYKFEIIAGIILKDHIHLLIHVNSPNTIPKIVTSFKVNFSKNLPFNENQTIKQKLRREKGIWQRKYYDHIIRNEEDLNKYLDYIHYNSMKHYNIAPKDWEYATFKKFVENKYYEENWCNFMDKYNINSINLE